MEGSIWTTLISRQIILQIWLNLTGLKELTTMPTATWTISVAGILVVPPQPQDPNLIMILVMGFHQTLTGHMLPA